MNIVNSKAFNKTTFICTFWQPEVIKQSSPSVKAILDANLFDRPSTLLFILAISVVHDIQCKK